MSDINWHTTEWPRNEDDTDVFVLGLDQLEMYDVSRDYQEGHKGDLFLKME
jgi:hypothetical protein